MTPAIKPIEKSIAVPLTPSEAFRLFLEDMTTWWPIASHSVSGDAKIEVDPRKGGKIIEVARDGSRHIWGTFIGWEDGEYASFSWHPGREEDEATVVSVTFSPSKDGCTVELTHGGWEILGETADAVSQSYISGWEMVLGTYCSEASNLRVLA